MWTYGKTSKQASRIRLFMLVIIVALICLLVYKSGYAEPNIHEYTARFVDAVINDDYDSGYELMKDEYVYRHEFDEYFEKLCESFEDVNEYALMVGADIHTFDYETRKEYLGTYHLITDKGNYKVETIAADDKSGLIYFAAESYDGEISTANIISKTEGMIISQNTNTEVDLYEKARNAWNVIAFILIAISAYDCFRQHVRWKYLWLGVIIIANLYLYRILIPVGVIIWRFVYSKMIVDAAGSAHGEVNKGSIKLNDDLIDDQNAYKRSRKALRSGEVRVGDYMTNGIGFFIFDAIRAHKDYEDIKRLQKRRDTKK